MDEEHDDIALGFVPDAYLTEYHHPGSRRHDRGGRRPAAHRGPGQRKALWRSLLFAGFRFGAVDLQDLDRRAPLAGGPGSGRHLDAPVQHRLVEHVSAGGRLLLLGPAPERDLEDRECRLLLDALALDAGEVRRAGRTTTRPCVARLGRPHPRDPGRLVAGAHAGGTPLLTEVDGHVCGVEASIGTGTAVLLAAELPSMPAFFAAAAARLGVEAGLAVAADVPGVVVTSTVSPGGDRMLHVLNPTGNDARVTVCEAGEPFGGEVLHVPAHTGHLLPWGLTTPWGRVESSTAEVVSLRPDEMVFGRPVGESFADPHLRLALDVDKHLRVQVTGSTETSVARRAGRYRGCGCTPRADRAVPGSADDGVAQRGEPVREPTLLEQPQVEAEPVRQVGRAAADHDRRHDNPDLVDQPGPEGVFGQTWAADEHVRSDAATSARTASGSKLRSRRVRGVETSSSVVE